MKEATKTKQIHGSKFLPLLIGEGIDIGCGNDPITANAQPFDQVHGDANHISRYTNKQYDFVFSSHALEHMQDPLLAIQEWFGLLKPDGHIITIVPDEDLYEQGTFPSRFNQDHKWTFTLKKSKSWSPRSINVLDLANTLEKNHGAKLIFAETQEDNYDRSLMIHRVNRWNLFMGNICGKLRSIFRTKNGQAITCKVMSLLGAVIDQTALPDQRLAQILFIIKKTTLK